MSCSNGQVWKPPEFFTWPSDRKKSWEGVTRNPNAYYLKYASCLHDAQDASLTSVVASGICHLANPPTSANGVAWNAAASSSASRCVVCCCCASTCRHQADTACAAWHRHTDASTGQAVGSVFHEHSRAHGEGMREVLQRAEGCRRRTACDSSSPQTRQPRNHAPCQRVVAAPPRCGHARAAATAAGTAHHPRCKPRPTGRRRRRCRGVRGEASRQGPQAHAIVQCPCVVVVTRKAGFGIGPWLSSPRHRVSGTFPRAVIAHKAHTGSLCAWRCGQDCGKERRRRW